MCWCNTACIGFLYCSDGSSAVKAQPATAGRAHTHLLTFDTKLKCSLTLKRTVILSVPARTAGYWLMTAVAIPCRRVSRMPNHWLGDILSNTEWSKFAIVFG